MGKLIIIDGTDGSGKATQSNRLFKRLEEEGKNVKKIEFPNYKSESSALIKMYLNGDFGKNPEDVNAFAASCFFAVDRFASFKMEWEKFYNQGGIIIADRYTTSNMVHQAAKIKDIKEKESFLNWLYDFEYNKLRLPKPDLVIFLDVPPSISLELIKDRPNKMSGSNKKDIHEENMEYILNSYENALYCAEKYGWVRIKCFKEQSLRTIEEIHEDIYKAVKKIL
ncbi:dTMP kinase [Caloramator fervidus]|uniref:Thymidylate kinase n=1 Tax=Caloramator fervidus TaxID=29344 RepID=A0A1H5XQK0_9CLOT|nr:deoxynucleoside kinase [Caloramator fervidus]SEG13923.1 dTMP kinase [Caloramator fervidus]